VDTQQGDGGGGEEDACEASVCFLPSERRELMRLCPSRRYVAHRETEPIKARAFAGVDGAAGMSRGLRVRTKRVPPKKGIRGEGKQ